MHVVGRIPQNQVHEIDEVLVRTQQELTGIWSRENWVLEGFEKLKDAGLITEADVRTGAEKLQAAVCMSFTTKTPNEHRQKLGQRYG